MDELNKNPIFIEGQIAGLEWALIIVDDLWAETRITTEIFRLRAILQNREGQEGC